MLITGLVPRVIVGLTGNTSLVNFLLLCKARTMLKPASATFSMACVCLAAFDRYLYSSLDLRRQRWVTLQQTRLIITITVILCLVVFSPYAVFYTAPVPSSCSIVNPIFIYVQPCLSLIFYNLAPVVILSIICSLTWRNLGQQTTEMELKKLVIIIGGGWSEIGVGGLLVYNRGGHSSTEISIELTDAGFHVTIAHHGGQYFMRQ
ncbi:unnamed protein product [Rotaria sp. Silwood1]|nr:unnamed protein product [Rotaria sp. Silwood1]CAF4925952.1 unnamed protein product [Rotaria sp. Silwood1]